MTYSYSQLSHYLSCPRRYRHRYLDGWQEKDNRAAMLFGRCFEQALGAYFRKEDAAVTLYREWAQYQKQPLRYSERDSWDRMLEQGVELLNRFCQEDRIRITQPRKNLQIKFVRPLSNGNDFVAYVDALGKLAAACSNGRPPQPATPSNPTACWRLTRSYLPTPGSPASPKSPRWCSYVNVWSKSSTCAPPSATNSGGSSVT